MGVLGSVGVALESTWGEPIAPTTYLEVSHADVRPVVHYEVPRSVRATRARRGVRSSAMLCSGRVSLDVCAGGMGELLKAALGTVTTTLVASSAEGAVYEHTFTRCDTTGLPSLTVEQNMGGLTNRQISGVRVNQLTLSLAPGRALLADADCRGKDEQLVSPTSAVYPTDGSLEYSGFAAQVGGEANEEVEEFLVRFGNGLVDNVWTAGSGGRLGRLPAGAFSVGGRFAMAFESTTAHEAFVNGEPSSLTFTVAGPAVVGSWGYGLEVELPRVRYFSATAPLIPGRLVYDIAFEALLDTSLSPPVDARCRLWNSQASY
jgi:hypothetical protein